MKKSYGKNVGIALDQLANALSGGWPDETLSSRAYRWARDGVRHWPAKVINRLAWWDKEVRQVRFDPDLDVHDKRIVRHCELSYESEQMKRHHPPELRGT